MKKINKDLDRIEACYYDDIVVYTDFLNPVEATDFLKAVSKMDKLYTYSFGGVEDCERSVIGVAKKGVEISKQNFPITPLKITYNRKVAANKLTHRDFLGSVLALGINRCKVGDIIINESCVFTFIYSTIVDYVMNNLFKIGNEGVSVTVAAWDDVYAVFADYTIKRISIASLRADALVASVFSLSRDSVNSLSKSDKLLVNWTPVGASKAISIGDVVTLRGYGRLKVKEILGQTKKEKISLLVQVY